MILAIETSCDDTCAAVVDRDGEIRANVISSQGVHDRYGGVVPEVAVAPPPRARQRGASTTRCARPAPTLDDVDLVAVTQGPGLVGALLVGVATAKALAAARGLPLAPVDHLQGHVAANFLAPEPFEPPFLCLIACGGHTLLARVEDHDGFRSSGTTLDDAAGEAFDKGARMLGLPLSRRPAPAARWPRRATRTPSPSRPPSASPGLDFSFAGLKTALLYKVRDLGEEGAARAPRRPRRLLPARDRRGARAALRARAGARPASSAWPSAAASRPTGRCASGWRALGVARARPAAGAVHRQRGDDRQRRAVRRAAASPTTCARRLRHRRARPVSPPTLYGRPGCHLCDDALAVLERARRHVRGGRHRGRRRAAPRLPGAHPGRGARRRGALRLLRRRGRPAGRPR